MIAAPATTSCQLQVIEENAAEFLAAYSDAYGEPATCPTHPAIEQLAECHDQTLRTVRTNATARFDIAPGGCCELAFVPAGSFWGQAAAALLDLHRAARAGRDLARLDGRGCPHLAELHRELVGAGAMEPRGDGLTPANWMQDFRDVLRREF